MLQEKRVKGEHWVGFETLILNREGEFGQLGKKKHKGRNKMRKGPIGK